MDSKTYLIQVGQQIQKIYNPDLIKIVIQRFILGNSQEKTAEILDVSCETVKRREKQALEIFTAENSENVQKS